MFVIREINTARDPGDSEDVFELLVTSYRSGGRRNILEEDLTWRPATDAYDTGESFVVQVDLAGLDPGAIEVMTDGKDLLISGIRQDIAPPGKKHYLKMEINVGPFLRRISLPDTVDVDSAKARYQRGFLFISFAKGDREPAGRQRIDIDDE